MTNTLMPTTTVGQETSDAIEMSMQEIAEQVQSIVTASERVSSTFHATAQMIGEFLEVLTYTFDTTSAEQRSLAGKYKVLESREKGSRTFRDGLEKHADELKKTFEKDLERYEKRIKEIPSGNELMAANMAHLALDELEIAGSLALVVVSKNPLGLKKTWDSFSKSLDSWQLKESSDDGKPAHDSFSSGLKWDDIPSITKEILPLLQAELELTGDAVEVSFTAKSGRTISWDPKQIDSSNDPRTQLCKNLDALNKSRNSDKSKTAIEAINRLSRSIRKINNSRNVLTGLLGSPKPSKEADGTKKEKKGQLAGDKALDLSMQAMKTSQGVLDTSRVLYEDSLGSLFKSNRELIDLIGKVESTKVKDAQAQDLLKSMAAPVAFLGQMHVSFYRILSLFGSLSKAYESPRIPIRGRLWTARCLSMSVKMFEQVKRLQKVLRVTNEVARLYIHAYDNSIKVGISMAIRMQDLLMADAKDIPALIDSHRTKVVAWARASQTTITNLIIAKREAKLAAIKKRIEEMSREIKKAEIQAAKSGGVPGSSDSDADFKAMKEFRLAHLTPSDTPLKRVKRVLAPLSFT